MVEHDFSNMNINLILPVFMKLFTANLIVVVFFIITLTSVNDANAQVNYEVGGEPTSVLDISIYHVITDELFGEGFGILISYGDVDNIGLYMSLANIGGDELNYYGGGATFTSSSLGFKGLLGLGYASHVESIALDLGIKSYVQLSNDYGGHFLGNFLFSDKFLGVTVGLGVSIFD